MDGHRRSTIIRAVREALLLIVMGCSSETARTATPTEPEPATPSFAIEVVPPAASAAPSTAVRGPHKGYALAGKADLPDVGWVQEIVVQSDGKLLVVGEKGIARVRPDLSVDTAFGEAGVVQLEGPHARPHRTAVDGQGRILVAGYLIDKRAEDLLVVRLLPSGTVDTSFGSAGRVVLDRSGSDDRPSAVFTNGGDTIVIGNHQQGKGGRHYQQYLVRFDAAGKETQFAFFDCIPASREFVTRARADGDGWLLTGYAINSDTTQSGMFVARLRNDGTLDPAWGDKGVTWHRTGALGRAVSWVLVPMANGDIIAGAEGGAPNDVGIGRGYLARFDKHGRIVASWGDAGIAWAEPGSTWLSFVAADGDQLIAADRAKPGLLTISASGQASSTVTFEEGGRYDEGVLLSDGDIVVAGRGLRRFSPIR